MPDSIHLGAVRPGVSVAYPFRPHVPIGIGVQAPGLEPSIGKVECVGMNFEHFARAKHMALEYRVSLTIPAHVTRVFAARVIVPTTAGPVHVQWTAAVVAGD